VLCASDAVDAADASRLRHHDSADQYLSLLCDLVLLISVDKPPSYLCRCLSLYLSQARSIDRDW